MIDNSLIRQKNFDSLAGDEIIFIHINSQEQIHTKDHAVISTLKTAESNMRSSNINIRSKVFAPALCAFAILDQIGNCYRNKLIRLSNKSNGIQKALHNWCGIDDRSEESDNLYRFRNGIVHNASLVNISKTNPPRHFIFRYSSDIDCVVEPSSRQWNGSSEDICDGTISVINTDKLVQLTSDALNKLRDLFGGDRANLEVCISTEDIRTRFLHSLPVHRVHS